MAKILNCKCGQELDIEGFTPGQQVQCPQCNQVLTVPGQAPAVTMAMAIDDEDDLPQRPTGPGTPGYVNPSERRKRAAARETTAAQSRLKKVILWPCLALGLACFVVAGLGVKWKYFTEPAIQIVTEDGFDVLYARVNVGTYKNVTFTDGPRKGQAGYTRVVDGKAEQYEKVEVVTEGDTTRVFAWKYPEEAGPAVKTEPFTGGEVTVENIGPLIVVFQRIKVKPDITPADKISYDSEDQAVYTFNGLAPKFNRDGTWDVLLGEKMTTVKQSGFWFYEVKTEMAPAAPEPLPAEPVREEPTNEPPAATDEPSIPKTRSRVVETDEAPPASEAVVPEDLRPKLIPNRKLADLPIVAQERSTEQYQLVTLRGTSFFSKTTGKEVAVAYYRAEDQYLTEQLGKFKLSEPPMGLEPKFFIWSGSIIGLVLMLAFAFFLYETYFSKAAKKAAEQRRAEEASEQAQKA